MRIGKNHTHPLSLMTSLASYRHLHYRMAGNFRGRKLSRISRFFSHPRKFSPRNSRHATPIMRPVLTFRESFLREMLLSYRSAKVFSLENFPLYGNFHMHTLYSPHSQQTQTRLAHQQLTYLIQSPTFTLQTMGNTTIITLIMITNYQAA